MRPILNLDHFFLLTSQPEQLAARIATTGLKEGPSNTHPGQGTQNRRFFLSNSTLELLTVSNPEEASTGPASALAFESRQSDQQTSSFGLIVRSESDSVMFDNWEYQPDYFPTGVCFLVGENSHCLSEPLCICMPPSLPKPSNLPAETNWDWSLSLLSLDVNVSEPSSTLNTFGQCERVEINCGRPGNMRVQLNDGRDGKMLDLQPEAPLVLEW